MRITDEELGRTLGLAMAVYSMKGTPSAYNTLHGLLDLQDARKAIRAYVAWCDNKAGPNTIPYEVLDNLRKCVEHE